MILYNWSKSGCKEEKEVWREGMKGEISSKHKQRQKMRKNEVQSPFIGRGGSMTPPNWCELYVG
jgi:hypothetical protein